MNGLPCLKFRRATSPIWAWRSTMCCVERRVNGWPPSCCWGTGRNVSSSRKLSCSSRSGKSRGAVALICVPFGESRDQSQVRDVAVQNLPDQYTVFVSNELAVRAMLQIRGYAGRRIPVELLVTDPAGNVETIGPTSASVEGQDEQVAVDFNYMPRKAGQYRLRLRVPPQIGEQVTENNELSSFVTVLDGGLRVLLVAGNLGWQETKFIRRSLDESPDIQLDVWLDTRNNKSEPLELPSGLEQDYDVIILSDIDAEALGDQNGLTIATAVGNGKGLMMLGGLQSFGPGGYARSPLQPVIPVVMERLERQAPDEPIRTDVHLQGELKMIPTRDQFVTRLTAPLANKALWSQLPSLQGANRFRGLKPGADVLLETQAGQPLLVRSQFGAGRVLAFAGDSTYRWYRRGLQAEHKRFWRQAVLWLAKKDETQQDEVWLTMRQRRFQPGARAAFTVGARDTSGEPVDDALIEVRLLGPDGLDEPLSVSRGTDDWTGKTNRLAAGEYQLIATATRGNVRLGEARGSFQVRDLDLELSDPAANPRQMEALAEITADVGGAFLASEQLAGELAALNEKLLDAQIEVESKWQLTDTNLDASALFGTLFTLLVLEWFLRKRWGLV